MIPIRLTDAERELLERVLDAMAGRACAKEKPSIREIRDYERAVALVRERPSGSRRIRSDFRTTRKSAPQAEIPID